MLREFAGAEDAANKGVPCGSGTSCVITDLRPPKGETSQSHVRATADSLLKSTAHVRVARTEENPRDR